MLIYSPFLSSTNILSIISTNSPFHHPRLTYRCPFHKKRYQRLRIQKYAHRLLQGLVALGSISKYFTPFTFSASLCCNEIKHLECMGVGPLLMRLICSSRSAALKPGYCKHPEDYSLLGTSLKLAYRIGSWCTTQTLLAAWCVAAPCFHCSPTTTARFC